MICLFILVFNFVGAHSLDPLIESQTIEEFMEKEKLFTERKRQNDFCKEELEKKLFPRHCFSYLLESIHWEMNRVDWEFRKNRYNHLCIIHRKKLRSQSELKILKSHPLLNEACRRALEEQSQDLYYMENREMWSEY